MSRFRFLHGGRARHHFAFGWGGPVAHWRHWNGTSWETVDGGAVQIAVDGKGQPLVVNAR
jgi:hypothetical protein